MAPSKIIIPMTRIIMENGMEYKAQGHPQVIALRLKQAREEGFSFHGTDAQQRKYEIPSKYILKGKCSPDGECRL